MGRFWEQHSHISRQTKTLPTKFTNAVNLIIWKQQFYVNNYSSVIYIFAISGTVYNICIIIRRTSPFSSSLFPARLSGLLFLRQAGALTTKLRVSSYFLSCSDCLRLLSTFLWGPSLLSTCRQVWIICFWPFYVGGTWEASKTIFFTFFADIKSGNCEGLDRH